MMELLSRFLRHTAPSRKDHLGELVQQAYEANMEACRVVNESRRRRGEPEIYCDAEYPAWEGLMGMPGESRDAG